MKTSLVSCGLSLAVFLFAQHGHAQTTAFTYQGRLSDGGSPAQGPFDFRFALRDAATNGVNLGVNVLAPVHVSNGVFTVTLDFGAGSLSGASRWLEIGVRTNGSSSPY